MRNLFIKAFVAPFYKAFLGLFVLIFIAFGLLMEVRQHVIIGERILQHPIAFITLILIFLLYGWLHYRFQINLIQHRKYHVFHQMALFKSYFSGYQLCVWGYNHLLLLVYAGFLSYLSLISKYWFQPILLWVTLIGMYLAYRYFLFHFLAEPYPDPKPTIVKRLNKKRYAISRAYWLILHLKEHRLLLLMTCKFLILILLKLFFYSFSTGSYDARWLQFGVLCASFINLPLWLEKKEFESGQLKTFLNLPRSIFSKSWVHLYNTLQIIAPEILYVIFQYPNLLNVRQLFPIIFLSLSLNLGIIALINFTKHTSHLSRNVILVFFSLFLLIIFGFPIFLVSLIAIVTFLFSIRSPYAH